MIYQLFIVLCLLDVACIWYSVTHSDTSYYTDVVISICAIVFTGIIAHTCFIGIDFNCALDTHIQYACYRSSALGLIMTSITALMTALFVSKILELTHQELNQI